MKASILLILAALTVSVSGMSYYYDRMSHAAGVALAPAPGKHRIAGAEFIAHADAESVYADLSERLAWHGAWCGALALLLGLLWRDSFTALGERIALGALVLLSGLPPAALWYCGILHS